MKKTLLLIEILAIFMFVSCGGSSSGSNDEDSCPTLEGLMWSSLSQKHMIWVKALDYCNNLKECGHSDWRLPNINELRRLIKNCPDTEPGGACIVSDPDYLSSNDLSEDCFCQYIDSLINGFDDDHYHKFFEEDGDISMWSSSAVSDSEYNETTEAWEVDFGSGGVYDQNPDSQLYVRCVR